MPSPTAPPAPPSTSGPSLPASTPPRHAQRTRSPLARLTLPALLLLTPVTMLLALGMGPVALSPAEVSAVLWPGGTDPQHSLVITEIRLPRVLLAALAGAGLAVAGAAMQAWFRNPLAEPGVTGVASGAALGAVLVLVLGAAPLSFLGSAAVPAAAFCGALAVLLVVQLVALTARDSSPVTVLLVGIALNAFCGALTGAVVANADDPQAIRGAMFWLQGDLTSASWGDLRLVALPVIAASVALLMCARSLNLLLLGDETAASIGLEVGRLRFLVLVLTSVLVGATVAVTGVIGFVGLVAPHVVRLLVGTDHRILLPASALLGALFLVAADTVARTAPIGTAWQTGVVTALVGSPLFLALVLRSRHTSGRAA